MRLKVTAGTAGMSFVFILLLFKNGSEEMSQCTVQCMASRRYADDGVMQVRSLTRSLARSIDIQKRRWKANGREANLGLSPPPPPCPLCPCCCQRVNILPPPLLLPFFDRRKRRRRRMFVFDMGSSSCNSCQTRLQLVFSLSLLGTSFLV